jgi:hypothetical protein
MGMRLIKNVSPALIKVNISIQKTDGTHLNLWLNHGESILVQDTEVATKSLIIQNKKGNIDIMEYNDVANQLNFYQVYPAQKEKDTINTDIVDSEFQNPFEKEEETENNSEELLHNMEQVTTESESVIVAEPVKNKGGRPKGATNKKKKKKKTSKPKDIPNTPNIESN